MALAATSSAAQQTSEILAPPLKAVVSRYCVSCHDADANKGGLDLERISRDGVTSHSDEWEKVIRKMRARQMPPVGKERPGDKIYDETVAGLSSTLDRAAVKNPNPGRTETFRRLNRTEYQNAIRDLLALDIDAAALLPRDDASHGFDNVTVGELSPTLLNRYISAAEKISRLAVGAPWRKPGGDTYRPRPDLTQEENVEGLPPGTRGGTLVNHTFPRDGDYEIQIRLTRDRNEEVEGLREPHEVVVLVDRQQVQSFTVAPPKDRNFEKVDAHLKVRVPMTAGPHQVGVTFLKNSSSLLENRRQPYLARYNMHRHPRLTPAIYQVSVNGPYDSKKAGDSPSRRQIFVCYPTGPEEEDACAGKILSALTRRAYRRPVTDADLEKPMGFYRGAKAEHGFEAGIEAALNDVLINPEFLFRIEREPAGVTPGAAYRLGDVALASRLSFFLWSSIPDDELLTTAERGELHKPRVLEKQLRRMLADFRAKNLAQNFAEQWLHLRNLESITPDLRLFPEFDDNLRQAFRRETELHFETMLREDRSVLDLLKADYTFLNERLAKHYGIPNVYGSQFRRVTLDKNSERGGLLRQGGVLTVTSYATRTSPVIRGNWILGNLLGTPPPPPPPNVPNLKENTVSESLPMRARLAEHRANAACASCHSLMDPVGFALENFDATGRWRTLEDGQPIDASGGLPDGSQFMGVAGLEAGLLKQSDLFVSTLTEKLLTFALGRGIEPSDAPAIRKIVRNARANDHRFSSVILGVVNSTPFTMRKAL
ncbi:MAG: hypothetical protein QOF48_94 [Verrucomicrobiota bacterium]